MKELIRVRNLRKIYGIGTAREVLAVDGISFEAGEGEFISLVGSSGCGKTTVLKIVAGLIPKTSGEAFVNGREVKGPIDDAGIVFQQPNLLPWRSVFDNIMLPVEVRGHNREEYNKKINELIELVGLQGFEKMPPYELSGGMQQRVSICRALITDPSILFMDEPFGALDALTRDRMDIELARIFEKERKTILFVTHNINEAVLLSDKVVVFTPRPGRLSGIVEIDLDRPRDLNVMREPEFADLADKIREKI